MFKNFTKKFKDFLKNFPWGYLIFAVLFIAIGVVFIAYAKEELLDKAVLIIGALLTLFAIVYGVLTLSQKERSVRFFFRMSFAVLGILCGVATMIARNQVIDGILAVVGLLLIIDGSFKLQTTVRMKSYRSAVWWIMLVISLLSIGGGFTITKFYNNNAVLFTVLLGITLIIDGIGNLMSAFVLPIAEKKETAAILSAAVPEATPTEDNQ